MNLSTEILYEDDVMLAVNKPAGLPCHATPDPMRPHLQGVLEKERGREFVLFHRLDLDTTGVVLFGKDPAINRAMTEMFRDRLAHKTYWAVVDGRWLPEWKEVRTFITKGGGGRWMNVRKGKGGDSAVSEFKVLASNGDKSWVEVNPQTGRTHQIRLHCLERGHPVLGDALYGVKHPKGVPMALHARRIEFKHPLTAKPLSIEAPAPDYWREVWLKGLQAYQG